PLPTRADQPGVEGEDQPRQGLRPDPAPRPGGGGLPRDGRAPRDQDAAAPVTRFAPPDALDGRTGAVDMDAASLSPCPSLRSLRRTHNDHMVERRTAQDRRVR